MLQQFHLHLELGHSILCKKKQKPKPQAKVWREGRVGQKKDEVGPVNFPTTKFY